MMGIYFSERYGTAAGISRAIAAGGRRCYIPGCTGRGEWNE